MRYAVSLSLTVAALAARAVASTQRRVAVAFARLPDSRQAPSIATNLGAIALPTVAATTDDEQRAAPTALSLARRRVV